MSEAFLATGQDAARARRAYQRARSRPDRPADTSPRRIYELLRASIRDGSISAGQQLDENELVREYNGSRNSVRKALQLLAEEGLVDRTRRVGTSLPHTIVRVAPTEVGPRAYRGTPHEGRLHVVTTECRRVVAGREVGRRLRIEACAEVVRLEQVGYFDDEPLYVRTGYLVSPLSPAEFMARIERCHVDYPPLPVAFERVLGRPYGESIYSVEAVGVEERIAALLEVRPGTPTLLRELTTTDVEGSPFELSFTYFRSGRVALAGIGTFGDAGAGVA